MTDVKDALASELDFDFSMEEESETPPQSGDSVAPDGSRREKQRHLSLLSRIPVTLTLEVASVDISLAELVNVRNDSVVELDKLAGEPLDVKVNGILFGKAEVVVLNDKYGLRIIEFNNKELSELAL
ncbi:flagellar motor switch protein FliN [Erwinia oleae]|uniref:flagellar motor switch protein FliN n=1 Tax=Erwinia oleae TaxID=796334 RepID=UPI0005563B37|nr:flagellar motor switch protein FliN [Erwinia oleae]